MRKLLLALTILLVAGCTVIEVPAPKQFNCGDWNGDMTSWYCVSRVTDKCIRNEYVEFNQCDRIEKGEQ